MFDFLLDDAVEALAADHREHGAYREETVKQLKVNALDLNDALRARNLPPVRRNIKATEPPKPTEEEKVLFTVEELLSNPDHLAAVGPSQVARYASVSDLQRTAIALLLDYHDKRPIRVKLKDIEISTSTYHQWLADAKFQELLRKELDRRFKNVDIDAKLGLTKLVLDGDLNAIKFYYEFTGQFKPHNETQINLTVVLAKLMDVLVRHIDPELLSTIGDTIETEILLPLNQDRLAN